MKKSLFIVGMLVLLGCGISDRSYTSKYTYTNDTEWEISVTTSIPPFDKGREEHFTLLPGESETLTFSKMGDQYPDPFSYNGGNSKVTVSNGIKKVECSRYDDNNGIFDPNNYIRISSKRARHLGFVFRPDYFDNGVPIE